MVVYCDTISLQWTIRKGQYLTYSWKSWILYILEEWGKQLCNSSLICVSTIDMHSVEVGRRRRAGDPLCGRRRFTQHVSERWFKLQRKEERKIDDDDKEGVLSSPNRRLSYLHANCVWPDAARRTSREQLTWHREPKVHRPVMEIQYLAAYLWYSVFDDGWVCK